MIRARFGAALAIAGLVMTAAAANADVKSQQKTQMKFEGAVGKMVNLFAGKAAKEGIVQTVAVKGDRKITLGDDSGQIVDLNEEKIYDLNLKNKTYKVTTFAELRKKMQEERAKAEEQARKTDEREKKDPNAKEMEVDFSIKETGQKREINGYACREIVATVDVHEKGRKIEQAGGISMRMDMWMAPAIPAMKELAEFDVRYAKKLMGDALPTGADMAQMLAMYPGVAKAMERMQKENVKMDGTPIQTVTTVQTVASPEQAAQQAKRDEPSGAPTSVGGLLGRLGRKKAADDNKDKEGQAPGTPGRSTLLTSTTEVQSVSTSVAAGDVAIPTGFKEK